MSEDDQHAGVARRLLFPPRPPRSVVGLLRRSPPVYRLARAGYAWVGRRMPSRTVPGVPGRVHPNDFMLASQSRDGIEWYVTGGQSVVETIGRSVAAAGRTLADVDSMLDFGCGYGRVTRFLVGEVAPSRIWVVDVLREGVDFCASEFGVHPLYSTDAISALRLGPFDFVFAISVLTHLTRDDCVDFLRFLHRALAPGGVCMFTTHGQYSLENLSHFGPAYEERAQAIVDEVAKSAIAYVPYPHSADGAYGLTWHRTDWIVNTMSEVSGDSMKLVLHEPKGLHLQDVFAFQRQS